MTRRSFDRLPTQNVRRAAAALVLLLCCLAWGGGGVSAAPAAIRTVGAGCTYPTLQAAVNAAASGDDIRIRSGTYLAQTVISNKNLTISGGWDATCSNQTPGQRSTLNGMAAGSVLKISGNNTVLLIDLLITNGANDADYGGGIEIDDATVTLAAVDVAYNISNYGGGVHMTNADLLLTNGSTIDFNTATFNGGGIYSTGSGSVTLQTGTLVRNNEAYSGGGIFIANANLTTQIVTLNGTASVRSNLASGLVGLGGGIYMQGGRLNVTADADVFSNDAYSGGGIQANNGAQVVVAGKVWNNDAILRGGGINISGATSALQLNAATIKGNTAGDAGGGIAVNQTQIAFIGGTLGSMLTTEGNSAGGNGNGHGGGLYCVAALCVLEDVLVSANSAVRGGGLYQSGGTLQVGGTSRVRENTATGNGGGIAGADNAALIIYDDAQIGGPSTIDGNTAGAGARGGGIYSSGIAPSLQLMSQVLIAHNSAYQGGGVALDGGTATFSGTSTIRDNTASESGGGGFALGTDIDMIHSAAIRANSAAVGGGGVFMSFGSLDLTQLAVIGGDVAQDGNDAGQFGGGIWVNATPVTLADDARVRFNSVDDHGGGVALQGNATFTTSGGQVADNTAGDNGGGIYAHADTEAIALTNTQLARNSAAQGGGVYTAGMLTISRQTADPGGCNAALLPADSYCAELRANSASTAGAAIYAYGSADVTLSGSAVLDHTTGQAAVYLDGAGVTGRLYDTLIADNSVAGYHSQLGGTHMWAHVTFARQTGQPFVLADSGALDVSNSIAWGNGSNGAIGSYSVTGGCNRSKGGVLPGSDHSDPLFYPSARGDYRLKLHSPAVNACANGRAEDLDGTLRPQVVSATQMYDQGAFEMVALPTAVRLVDVAATGGNASAVAIAIAIVIAIAVVVVIDRRFRLRLRLRLGLGLAGSTGSQL